MKSMLKKFWKDEAGLELVEYAIIAGLVVVGAITFISSIGGKVEDRFQQLDGNMN